MGVKQVVERLILVVRRSALVGGSSPGASKMVDHFELHDANEPSAQRGLSVETLNTLPSGGQAILDQILGDMVVLHPGEREAVE